MASRNVYDLHPALQRAFTAAKLAWLNLYPYRPVPILTATFRDNAEQAELYAKGRTKRGRRLTNAKPGQSAHNYYPSFAFDVAFQKINGSLDWDEVLFEDFNDLIQEQTGLITWGGNFRSIKDMPHWELTGWKREAKAPATVYRLQEPYMRDGFVKYMQIALAHALGVAVVADGVYGPKTADLVRQYQQSKGLKPDGIAGPNTLKALSLS